MLIWSLCNAIDSAFAVPGTTADFCGTSLSGVSAKVQQVRKETTDQFRNATDKFGLVYLIAEYSHVVAADSIVLAQLCLQSR